MHDERTIPSTTAKELFTTEVEVTGKRMRGAVQARFGRTGNLDPEIRFGSGRFSTENPDVWINGIPYSVAAYPVFCSNRVWRSTASMYSLRRCDAHQISDSHPTSSAMQMFREWAVQAATRLAEQHPDEFDRRPLFSVREGALDEFRVAFHQLELLIKAETRLNDVDNVRYDVDVDVDEISWTISRQAEGLAGEQGRRWHGKVIAIGYHYDEPVGYIVSGDPRPLVIPFELVRPKS